MYTIWKKHIEDRCVKDLPSHSRTARIGKTTVDIKLQSIPWWW